MKMNQQLFYIAACLAASISLGSTAFAVNAPLQNNPVFITPVPENQKIGPQGDEQFQKNVLDNKLPTTPEMTKASSLLDSVKYDGNKYYRDWVIERELKPLYEMEGKPIDPTKLEGAIKQINKNAPFKLKATINADASEEEKTELKIDVYEKQPWQISGTVDNQGRPRIGNYREGIQLTNDSLFGIGDKLWLQQIGAEDSQSYQLSYDVPINRYGGTVGGWGEYSHNQVDVPPRDKFGEHYGVGLRYIQPLDIKRIWTADLGLVGRHININQTHPDPRFLTAGLRFNKPDKFGNTNLYVQNFIGATRALGGDTAFWRIRGQAIRTTNLPWKTKLVLRGIWQYGGNDLPAIQMMPLAGAYSVRGYSEGYIYGDSGQFYSAEYYWPVPFMHRISPWVNDRVRGVAFFDVGQAFLDGNRNRTPNRATLMSTGMGLRFRLTQYAQGFCDFAWGIGNHDNLVYQNLGDPSVGGSMRIHFGLRSNLLSQAFKTRKSD